MKRFFKRRITTCIGFVAACIVAGCSSDQATAYPQGIEHVVVIGIDGLSPDGIKNAATPVMDSMIASGAVSWNVRTVLPSSSSQNWASMIMGAGREQHGVLDNDWEREEHSLPPIVTGKEGIFPTIFGLLRRSNPKAEIGAVYHWGDFGRLFEKEAVNYDHHFSTEDSTARAFADYLTAKRPVLSFVHFDHVDHAGHHDGHGSKIYYNAVARADSLIGRILQAVRVTGMDKSTLVIIMSDHGGVGYGHGGATPAEAEVAMILSGRGVRHGYRVRQQVYTYDLAATIAFALKLSPPYAWIGRPVKAAFEGFDEPANLWMGDSVLAAPKILPEAQLYRKAGALTIDEAATVTIENPGVAGKIRYTLNGSEPDETSAEYKGPFRLDSTAVVKAKFFDESGNRSHTGIAYFRVMRSEAGNGLRTRFYHGKAWKKLPSFAGLSPVRNWQSHEFSIDRDQILQLQTPDTLGFGLVFEGYLDIIQPGSYNFYTQSDDGSKLYIGNKEIVDNDGSHGVVEQSGSVNLETGRHAIRVEFFNEMGGFWLDALYKGPGTPKQLIPANRLFLSK